MTHIANCLRLDAGKSPVYITQETSASKPLVSLETQKHPLDPNELSFAPPSKVTKKHPGFRRYEGELWASGQRHLASEPSIAFGCIKVPALAIASVVFQESSSSYQAGSVRREAVRPVNGSVANLTE
jgi:hypothetical protein